MSDKMKIEGQTVHNLGAQTGTATSDIHLGERITAKIISIEKDKVILQKQNGEQFNATIADTLNKTVGDMVELEVVGLKQDQVMLKIVGEVFHDNLTDIITALTSSKVSLSDKNIEIANVLLQNKMPVTRENLVALITGMSKFKGVPVEKLLFLLKADIPLTDRNISELVGLQERNSSIQMQLQQIEDILVQPQNIDVSKKILDRIKEFEVILENSVQELYGDKRSDENLPKVPLSDYMDSQINDYRDNQSQQVVKRNQSENQSIDSLRNTQITDLLSKIPDKNLQRSIVASFSTENVEVSLLELMNKFPQQKVEIENLLKLVKNNSEQEIIHDRIKNEREPLQKPTDSENLKTIVREIKQSISHLYLQNRNELNDTDMIKGIYKELAIKLELIKQSISNTQLEEKSQINQLVDKLQQKIEFIQDINKYHTFVQLPIMLNETRSTANLYILKKKHSKNINPNDATIFLSLDTKNLGVVEILAHKVDKDISCKFQCDEKNTLEIVQKKIQSLHLALKRVGYNLINTQYSSIDRHTDVAALNALEEQESRKTFDMRI